MPTIKSSTSLRNDYSKISKYCRETGEPVLQSVIVYNFGQRKSTLNRVLMWYN